MCFAMTQCESGGKEIVMKLRKSLEEELNTLVAISMAAFHTDVLVGGDENEGPPGYDSFKWHKHMLQEGHVYSYLLENGQLIGGAILFEGNNDLYIGRIFIDPQFFGCGYGMQLMEAIESLFSDVGFIKLDTPIWNIRTNQFYKKCGYIEVSKDNEDVHYEKHI